jgi:hypothetical protein
LSDKIQQDEKQQNKMSFFDYATEIIGWLQIVASPLLLGLVLGAIIYFSSPSDGRLALGIFVALVGLIVGIIFATRVWKKQGTMHFVSRIMATPELDNLEEDKKSEDEI